MIQRQNYAFCCSFMGLMNLYESNYLLLKALVPNLLSLPRQNISNVVTGGDLHLCILEHTKYTSVIRLSHGFGHEEEHLPVVTVRIYYDTGQAEVLAWLGSLGGMDATGFPQRPSVVDKWRANYFLGKWMQFCLDHGHGFSKITPESQNTVTPS